MQDWDKDVSSLPPYMTTCAISHGKQCIVGSARSTSTSVVSKLKPGSWPFVSQVPVRYFHNLFPLKSEEIQKKQNRNQQKKMFKDLKNCWITHYFSYYLAFVDVGSSSLVPLYLLASQLATESSDFHLASQHRSCCRYQFVY